MSSSPVPQAAANGNGKHSAHYQLLTVGVGGATSSGKTTLAKHLLDLLAPGVQAYNQLRRPESDAAADDDKVQDLLLIHQDDFAPPEDHLPMHPKLGVRDWDTPYGSIDYARLSAVLAHLRTAHRLPSSHSSHDHLNQAHLGGVPLPPAFVARWQGRFADLLQRARSRGPAQADCARLQIALVDGFLLYFDARVRAHLDVRLFLRCERAVLAARREARSGSGAAAAEGSAAGAESAAAETTTTTTATGGYITASGSTWRDPPGYFEHVVWPSYELAHRRLFAGGDVEHGAVVAVGAQDDSAGEDGAPVPRLVLLDGQGKDSMQAMVERACIEIEQRLRSLLGLAAAHTERDG